MKETQKRGEGSVERQVDSTPRTTPPPLRLLAGLGNPGKQYENTRHNIGWMVIDAVARKHGCDWNKRQSRSIVAQGQVHGRSLILCKPLTYMNASGEAIAGLARFYKITPSEIMVIYDDMDLPLGKLRLRESGSAGGHNGVKSVIQHLNTTTFPRLRIGIGRPSREGIEHVLAHFSRDEQPLVVAAIERSGNAIEHILVHGITSAMNEYNKV